MNWRTEIEESDIPIEIDYQSNCLLLGSCFAENIGSLLADHKFHCSVNPSGINYNPVSLLKQLSLATSTHTFDEQELRLRDSTYVHLDFHSQFADSKKETCLNELAKATERLNTELKKANVIFISLGSSIVFKLKETGAVVSNCHKLPASLFEQYLLTQIEVNKAIEDTVSAIKKANANTSIVFTVSPIRHSRHGLINDNRSKAQLISAVHSVVDKHAHCYYFPSYEIMKDDLRDYRFYAEDLVHPTPSAINYIWECFIKAVMSSQTQSTFKEIEGIHKQLGHRFLTSDPVQQIQFLENLKKKISQHKLSDRFVYELEDIDAKLVELVS